MSQRSRTSFRLKNLYNFLLEHDSTNDRVKTLKLANNVWAFFLIFTITLIASPNENFLLNIGEGLAVGSIILFLIFEISWAYDRFDENESILNITLLFVPLWLIIVPLSVFIFGGLNTLFPSDIFGWILFFISISIYNYLGIKDEGRLDKEFIILWFTLNIFIISSILTGLLCIGIPNIHISLFLSETAIGCVIVFANFDIENFEDTIVPKLFNITLAGAIGAIVGYFFHYSLIFIFNVLILILAIIYRNHIEWLPNSIIGNFITRILLPLQSLLPWRTNHFFKYSCKILFLKESAQGYEFIHRRFRDHFALREIIPRLNTLDKNQKLEVINELVELKDASCNVLLELISDNNKKIRMQCLEGLGNIASAIAGKALMRIINETARGLKYEAINQLKNIRDVAAVPMLIEIINTHGMNSSIAEAAFLSLYKMMRFDDLIGLSEFHQSLYSLNNDIRDAVATILVEYKLNKGLPEVQELLQMLEREYYEHRKHRIRDLFKLKAAEVVPELLNMIFDEKCAYRSSVIWIFGELNATEAIPHLMKILMNENNSIDLRKEVIKALGKLNALDTIPELLNLFQRRFFREEIALSFKYMKKGQLPEWLRIFHMPYATTVQNDENMIMSKLNMTERLIMLYSENSHLQYVTAKNLITLKSSEVFPEILSMIQSSNKCVSYDASSVLQKLKATEIISELLIVLNNASGHVRDNVAETIAYLKPKDIVPKLLSMLKSDHPTSRYNAAITLGQLNAKETFPELLIMLQSDNKNTRDGAVEALSKLYATDILPDLMKLLKTEKTENQRSVIKVLGKLQAKEAISDLMSMLQNENKNFVQIFEALEEILNQSDCEYVVKDLIKLTNHSHENVRFIAINLLGDIGDGRSIEKLKSLLNDRSPVSNHLYFIEKDCYVYKAALLALEKIGTPQAKKIVDNWRKSQNDE